MNGAALRHPTPAAILVEAAARHDREVVSHRVEGDLHRLTRAELAVRARRLAGALAGAGLAAGDQIATLAWTGHRHLEVAFAACGSGAILRALDPGLHPDSIVRTAVDAGIRMVFFELTFMPLIEEIAPRLPAGTTLVALTDRANMPVQPATGRLVCYEELIARASDSFGWPIRDDKRLASLATPKQDGRRSPPPSTTDAFRPGGTEVVLSVIPMWRAGGWDLVLAAWEADATLVFAGPWLDGDSLRALAEREAATVVAATPRLWQGLLAQLERDDAALPRLRGAIVACDDGRTVVAVRPRRDPRAA